MHAFYQPKDDFGLTQTLAHEILVGDARPVKKFYFHILLPLEMHAG